MSNIERIKKRIDTLKSFTSVPGQITRQTYSEAWESAALWVKEEMERSDMQVRIDGIGNVIGTYSPGHSDEKPVGTGSHLDTVINGGAYDGVIGIVEGLEIVDLIREKGAVPPRPVEVIAFAEEEGGVFGKGCLGSDYLTGHTPLEQFGQFIDSEGISVTKLSDGGRLEKAAFGSDYGWGRNHFSAFLEVHAEQGAFLDKEHKHIGIVGGVVGIWRREISFHGQSNHAGTTEMSRRKDAVVAIAEFIHEAYAYGMKRDGRLVVTNGRLRVLPNQHNVVPGFASTTMEMRSDSDAIIQEAAGFLLTHAEEVGRKYGVSVEVTNPAYVKPIVFDKDLLAAEHKAGAGRTGVADIFSWAGHDAKLMAGITRSAMLFVPSREGMSHCPEEYTEAEDIAEGADFLLEVIEAI